MLSQQLDDSTVAGKRAFLSCDWRTREETLTARTEQAATELWLVNLAKPLMSGLLLPNSNNPRTAPTTTLPPERETLDNPLVENFFPPQTPWSTPRKCHEFTEQATRFAQSVKATPAEKIFLQKVGKALHQNYAKMAIAK